MKPPRKVLIFCMSGIGDVLMFTPALRLLRLAWKETRFVALTMRQSERELLQNNPDFDEVKFWPFLKESTLSSLKFLNKIRGEGFDLSILPCPTNRIYYNMISFVCHATQRVGFRYLKQSRCNLDFLNTILIPHRDDVFNIEHNLLLAESLAGVSRKEVAGWSWDLRFFTTPRDVEEANQFLTSKNLKGAPCVGFHVSSSRAKRMNRKCWPREKFVELMKRMRGEHPGLKFVIFCGDDDLVESEWIAKHVEGQVELVRNVSMGVVGELIRSMALFISNDSGIMHLASAVQTPLVAIFGPTNPRRSGPSTGSFTVVRTGIPCSPCFYHTSHDLECPAGINFACLTELSTDAVLQAVKNTVQFK